MFVNLRRVAPLFLILMVLLATPVLAKFGDPHTKASVLLEKTTVKPGEPIRGVFHLEMEPGWHTYWKYAGDNGLATEVAWTLPEGWKAEPLLWPLPEYIELSGMGSYAYEHEVNLPFILRPPGNAADGAQEVVAKLSWLECQDSCVPGDAELMFGFSVGAASVDGADAAVVADAFATLPTSRDDIAASKDGVNLQLHIPAALGGEGATFRFFPDQGLIIAAASPQQQSKDPSGSWTLKLEADPIAEKPPTEISGLLVVTQDGKSVGYDFKTKLLDNWNGASATPGVAAPVDLAAVFLTIGAAFLGGLVLNLMPCVFPVLSLKVLSIVEQSRQEGSKAWHHGVVFTLGVLVSFWVLSGVLLVVRAAGSEVGWGYHLQNPTMVGFLAALFLLIGLNLFGVFEVGENLTQLSNVADKKHGFAHSFWSGVLTTLAATPCTAPFMGGAVGFALSQPNWVALAVFSSLALGTAAPYMTLTMFPSLLRKLPRPGAWMVTFKQILAFPMLVAVVWLVWVFGGQVGSDRMAMLLLALVVLSFAAWTFGKWGTSYVTKTRRLGTIAALLVTLGAASMGFQASRPGETVEKWQTFSPALVEQLVGEGKPVFLDFTADWCTSCKANELVTLSNSEVSQRFQDLGVEMVKGDWTKQDPVITAELRKHGRAGVPLYVLYPGDGKPPVVLPEVILPSTVLDALENVKKPT